MEKTVEVQVSNFLQSMAIQCEMPAIIRHTRMIPIHILFDDPAGVPHQAVYVCHPNHIDQVVKSLRRLTPVALPKQERIKNAFPPEDKPTPICGCREAAKLKRLLAVLDSIKEKEG